MRSTTNPIQVEAFEQIKASSQNALLRLIFRDSGTRGGQARISSLLVNNHTSIHRVTPLPSPPAPGGAQRAAFAVPYELLEGDRSFSVELEDGALVELPHPIAGGSTSGGTVDPPGPTARAGAGQAPIAVPATDRDLDAADAEHWLKAEAEARADAEVLQARVEQLQAEADEHNRELEARCDDLERRLADALAELEAVTKAERRAVREARQLKDKVAQQATRIDQLQASQS